VLTLSGRTGNRARAVRRRGKLCSRSADARATGRTLQRTHGQPCAPADSRRFIDGQPAMARHARGEQIARLTPRCLLAARDGRIAWATMRAARRTAPARHAGNCAASALRTLRETGRVRCGPLVTRETVWRVRSMRIRPPNFGKPNFGARIPGNRNAASELRGLGNRASGAHCRGNSAVRRWTRTDSTFGQPRRRGVHTTNSSPGQLGDESVHTTNSSTAAGGRRERGAQTRGAGNRAARAWTRRTDFVGHCGFGVVAKTNSSRGQPGGESVRHKLIRVAQTMRRERRGTGRSIGKPGGPLVGDKVTVRETGGWQRREDGVTVQVSSTRDDVRRNAREGSGN